MNIQNIPHFHLFGHYFYYLSNPIKSDVGSNSLVCGGLYSEATCPSPTTHWIIGFVLLPKLKAANSRLDVKVFWLMLNLRNVTIKSDDDNVKTFGRKTWDFIVMFVIM